MIIPNSGHLPLFILLGLWDVVCPSVARPPCESLLRKRRESRRRERGEDLGHGMPGPPNERAVSLMVARIELSVHERSRLSVVGHGRRWRKREKR